MDLRGALLHKVPLKLDVGAIYNINPRIAKAHPGDFTPVQHELVFDIDISDYDDVRNCCKETSICPKCWPFMRIGAKILHSILTKEFGFKHLLFVFSGRRGFHCWVCDRVARNLTAEARRAIGDYLSLVTGGMSMVKRVTLNPKQGIHPMVRKALEVIDKEFDDLMIEKQDFLGSDHLVQNILDLCTDSELQLKLSDCNRGRRTSQDRWNLIKLFASQHKRRNYLIQEIKLQHCFPRMDINVTKGMNHLLKLPFCIHPKTGNVCVPLSMETIEEFDLLAVPNIKSMTKGSLDPYLKTMKHFVDSLSKDSEN